MCVVCVHLRVFEENQADGSLQRERYVQRPRRVGNLASESSSSWPESPGWEGRGQGEIDLEKQAGQALKSLTGQAKGLGLYLKSNGEPLKVLELVTNMIKSADVGGFINAHTSGGHGRAGSPPGIHGVYSSRLRREERGQEDLAYEGLECLKSMFYRG